MRLVKRQELMTLPAGTLFAELQQEWVFHGLQLKGETYADAQGRNIDFMVKQLDWVDAYDCGEACQRLDEMKANPAVSHPIETAYGRHGLYDDDQVYLVYEPADTARLIAELTPGPRAPFAVGGPLPEGWPAVVDPGPPPYMITRETAERLKLGSDFLKELNEQDQSENPPL